MAASHGAEYDANFGRVQSKQTCAGLQVPFTEGFNTLDLKEATRCSTSGNAPPAGTARPALGLALS